LYPIRQQKSFGNQVAGYRGELSFQRPPSSARFSHNIPNHRAQRSAPVTLHGHGRDEWVDLTDICKTRR
jgi:hypothetical protein